MTTIQITIPDRLAEEAKEAGLLSPAKVEKWLRAQLKAQRAGELEGAMARMDSVECAEVMSPEAVAEEVAAMRREKRGDLNR